jgi:uncharacterized protein DUF397
MTAPPDELQWRHSRRSGSGNCVEVAVGGRSVLIRDSKDPSGPRLRIAQHRWAAFLAALKTA